MKKITLLITAMVFSLGMYGQVTCNQTFSESGLDGDPTVLTINAADVTCNGADAAISMQLTNAAESLATTNCATSTGTTWYSFALSIDGSAPVSVCAAEIEGIDITGFTTLTITSADEDFFGDSVTIELDVEVTFNLSALPDCDAALTSPADGSVFAPLDGDIEWSNPTGAVDGYELMVGTTSGGSEILAMTDVGNVNTYALGALAESTTYYVNITPYNSVGPATGCTEYSFTTLSTDPPANDDFVDAIAVACAGNYTGFTTFATLDEDDAPDGPDADLDAPNVWYSYTGSGVVEDITLDLCPSGYDTAVLVYTGTSGNLTLVADNDDGGTAICGTGNGLRSFLEFQSDGTTTYYITITGWNVGSVGAFDMTVSCAPSACQAIAGTLTANESTVALDGAGEATISATEDMAPNVPTDYDIVYVLTSGTDLVIVDAAATPSFVVDAVGDYTIHTLVALVDPAFSADPNYVDLAALPPGTTGGDVLDLIDAGLCAALDAVGAPITVTGSATLDFFNAQYIEETGSMPSIGDNLSLTVDVGTSVTVYAQAYELGVTDMAGAGAGISSWIAINDENTDPATWDDALWEVATYAGDAGNNDEYTLETVAAPTGTYYIAARWRLEDGPFTYGGFNGEWDGTNNVNIELIVAPIANDDFANAEPIVCGETYIGSTEFATLDEDDAPDGPDADLDAPNVWYSYTGSGVVEDITLDLCPSGYDTAVLVYTGTSGNLTLVADNDDGGTDNCGAGNGLRSFLEFQSDGTTTYYITITGWNVGSVGAFDMTVTCAESCLAEAGTLTADATPVTLDGAGEATISATEDMAPNVPTNYDIVYVLTSGTDLVIVDAAATPSFVVDAVGDYTIHTLVALVDPAFSADPNYVDLAALPPGTTGGDVLDLIDGGLCAALDAVGAPITVEAPLGIDDAENEAVFTYFPNPVKNTLSLNAQNTIEQVTMYNMLGQEVLASVPNTIDSELDMSGLETGTYFVKVTIANITKTVRVIKQ